MPFDLSYRLFWLSLAISAAAVAVFLWLMRTPRQASGVKREAKEAETDSTQKPV